MKSVSFTIKSNQSLRIGEVLQAETFECYSVSAKDAGLKPSADSLISDFHSVQFGVKEKSSLGFRLLYVEGDRDIVRRTFEILKDFSLSVDLVKLDKVTDYISMQGSRLRRFTSLPFVIETDELVRNIIESISKLSDEQKRTYTYEGLCNVLERNPEYRQYDAEKVEKILKEFKEKYYNPPKVVEL